MGSFILCSILFRVVLPTIILTCVYFRPCVLSALYLLLLLLSALFPVPSATNLSGSTGIYLKILILVSTLTTIGQIVFQTLMLLHFKPYGSILQKCEFLERLLRHCGFIRLDKLEVGDVFVWVTPEVIMFITSIVFYVLFSKFTKVQNDLGESGYVRSEDDVRSKKQSYKLLIALGKYLVMFALCLVAVLKPSVPGGYYFLIFLCSATWWGCYRDLQKGFAIVLKISMIIIFCHIFTFYAYQTDWPQELLVQNSTYARYFGFTNILSTNCDEPRTFIFQDRPWTDYAFLPALIMLFFICAVESKQLLLPQLIQTVGSSTQKYGGQSKAGILQDSTGSVIISSENPDDIPLKEVPERKLESYDLEDEDEKPTCFEKMIYALESILFFVIKSSYIGTNITMMAWSITYHSWLTFILLLWASILWMVPNQRKYMLRSSPFLVLYAWILLISAYMYSMDLTEAELPTKIEGIDLEQIGFKRDTHYPYKQLLAKSFYTVIFWITLRQFIKERQEARQNSALADMVAPLQLSVGTAAGITPEKKAENEIMQKFGTFLRKLLTKFWIWVVAITLFLVAITGQRMTSFRIMYMALFLIFILSFQFSFRVWRKMMFGFWLTVIIYSMIILILVYTYQFNNFPTYWEQYLHVDSEQQLDIGLEKYETKQLFMRLVTPTFFVIIAVIQLHYFHKDFLELSKPTQNVSDTTKSEANSSAQGGAKLTISDEDEEVDDEEPLDLTDLDNVSSKQVNRKFKKILKVLYNVINTFLLGLEIHMAKIVLFVVMVVCVKDVAAVNMIIVILLVFGATVGKWVVTFAINVSSLTAATLLLARMVYQIKYIDHDIWNVTCSTADNTTRNDAEWLGLYKIDNANDLPELVKWNIIHIVAVTMLCIINIRQSNFRASRGQSPDKPFFMFPKIKITNAHKDMTNYLKYLANYCFYRMGVEICLIALVATIGIRMDLYALFYSFWLGTLFLMSRKRMAQYWNFFLVFIAIFIPVQYLMVIGLPPSLCIEYPWDSEDILRRLQEWAYLMDIKSPPPPKKLLCDFALLILVARQSLVFRIERRYANEEYAGGSNESIIHYAEDKDFTIPVPDFITYSRSYLDIFKKTVFLPFMWITLAIVFLAGTNRVNLFSIGYLLGSFYFLWQGSDIYLQPIPSIIKKWNFLLGYNITVIFSKVALQLIGCLFFEYIKNDACWVIQLLGISCLRKFKPVGGIVHPSLIQTECVVPREYVGLAWDGACFAFMLLQRRLFSSLHFFHIVNESKASAILASRGAELIEELRQKRMIEQDDEERRVIEKIKTKMDRIKANQQKILGPNYKAPDSHYVAIRSGDYYMFDDIDNEDIDVFEEITTKSEDESEVQKGPKKQTLSELLSSAMKTDVGTAVRSASRTERKRRVSLPPPIRETAESPTTHFSAPPVVRIQEIKDDDLSEPQPSTSKVDIAEVPPEKTESKCQKFMNILLFMYAFFDSSINSATNFLNRYSKDYRYVLRVLKREKKILKETTDYDIGIRNGPGFIWQPTGSYKSLLLQSRGLQVDFEDDYETGEMSSYDQPNIIRLLLALWYIVLSHSDLLCYFVIFLNQVKNATFLSLPLPIMVFFWGTLTIPRPSKTFWITIIAYTQIIVLIKCMFQFQILPWNRSDYTSYPFDATSIIGIERKKNYAVWDLLLLLVVYFHRFMLKCLGLWKASYQSMTVLADGEYNIENGELKPKLDLNRRETRIKRYSLSVSKMLINCKDKMESLEKPEYYYFRRRKRKKMQILTKAKKGIFLSWGRESRRGSDMEHLVDESESEEKVYLHTTQVETKDMFPSTVKMAFNKYTEALKVFFYQLFDPTSRVAADVYTFMFICDFFNFFVILMGYSSFGTQQGDGGVSSYLEDNRVPVLFLLMLILQFLMIIVDRAIFLRKNIFAKIIFQFLQIFILHIWLFIIYPITTERSVNSEMPPQIYYMVKCFYLLFSAYQIRCGYPARILGNVLCKGYGYINMFLFKGFMLIPFLFELRTVMDWMWTDTSMTVFDWIKMEDIFAHIYQLKCTRHIESEYPQPRGERKVPKIKYMTGGGLLIIIIGIIWFPLVFFSLGNAVGKPNVPYDVKINVRLGPYEALYRMTAQSNSIFQFTRNDYMVLQQRYMKNKIASTFISNYEHGDIAAVKLSTDSATVWSISPPDQQRMIEEVESANKLYFYFKYEVMHETNTKEDPGIMWDETQLEIDPLVNNKINPLRQQLLEMLKQVSPAPKPLLLTYLMPKFAKVTSRGKTQVLSNLMDKYPDDKAGGFRNITLQLSNTNGKVWWEMKEECDDYNYKTFLQHLPYADCNNIMLYTFNDKIFPATLNMITGGGIIGLYTTLVFVASRVLRGFFSEICFKIMFDDMPFVDRVLQLTLDIYLVREAREFCLEEDLFAKLVFLYRSPETLIKWTRPPEEVDDEDNPEGDANN